MSPDDTSMITDTPTATPIGTPTDASTATRTDASGTTGLARGLEPDHRFRCDACGNVTRFDVLATARTRRYHHFDLGGDGHVEEEEVLSHHVESVTCRWCGRDDAVKIEASPLAGS